MVCQAKKSPLWLRSQRTESPLQMMRGQPRPPSAAVQTNKPTYYLSNRCAIDLRPAVDRPSEPEPPRDFPAANPFQRRDLGPACIHQPGTSRREARGFESSAHIVWITSRLQRRNAPIERIPSARQPAVFAPSALRRSKDGCPATGILSAPSGRQQHRPCRSATG